MEYCIHKIGAMNVYVTVRVVLEMTDRIKDILAYVKIRSQDAIAHISVAPSKNIVLRHRHLIFKKI